MNNYYNTLKHIISLNKVIQNVLRNKAVHEKSLDEAS